MQLNKSYITYREKNVRDSPSIIPRMLTKYDMYASYKQQQTLQHFIIQLCGVYYAPASLWLLVWTKQWTDKNGSNKFIYNTKLRWKKIIYRSSDHTIMVALISLSSNLILLLRLVKSSCWEVIIITASSTHKNEECHQIH